MVTLGNNNAEQGGAITFDRNSNFILKDNGSIMFINNSATYIGGALFINEGNVIIEESSILGLMASMQIIMVVQ